MGKNIFFILHIVIYSFIHFFSAPVLTQFATSHFAWPASLRLSPQVELLAQFAQFRAHTMMEPILPIKSGGARTVT